MNFDFDQKRGQPIITSKVQSVVLQFVGVIPANQSAFLTLGDQFARDGRFRIVRRRCTARLTQAVGSTPVGFPLSRVVDPSPAAGVGNTVPNLDQLRFQFWDDATQLDVQALPYSCQFGNPEEGDIRETDYVIDSERAKNFKLQVFNDAAQPIEVFVALIGTAVYD